MNSAVKQSLAPQGGPAPAMANPAKVPLAGQNLTAHGTAAAALHPAPAPAPPAPSMAPVTPNMAQMAHNMSHHGNLSLLNNATPVASPGKNPTPVEPQPLALTRTSDKKEPDSTGQSNGTVEQPKPATNAPAMFKPQNAEPNKEKLDIAKTSPSTPKPPEKPNTPNIPSTPQKAEQANTAQADRPSQPKVATANEAPEKSPAKPSEPKPAPTADVAPTQSNSKPLPESANNNQVQDKPATVNAVPATASSAAAPASVAPIASTAPTAPLHASPTKPEPVVESAKAEPAKPTEKKEEIKTVQSPNKPLQNTFDSKKEEVKPTEAKKEEPKPVKKDEKPAESPKKESQPVTVEKPQAQTPQKPEQKPEEKKLEKTAAEKKQEPKVTPKSTLKLATLTPAMRKRRQGSPKTADGTPPAKKPAEGEASTPDSRSKRNRTQVQLYQSPTPELTMATKLSASAGRATPTKPGDDKLIVFYKNEYLAVRNAEGGFYVCQAMQNVYRTTRKIKIRWLSQDKQADPKGETYKPDFYDVTDMETVLTTLSLQRASGGGGWVLKPAEQARAANILRRALQAERGENAMLSPEHPDGLDLSLYTDESQLEKRSPRKRAAKSDGDGGSAEESSPPAKKALATPKRSPKSVGKAKSSPKQNNIKRATKPAGSTPVVASTSKTATALSEKGKAKTTPPKPSPAKKAPVKEVATPSPVRQGRRSAVKESKPLPAPVPSTSTGKATRTPRKPPAHK